VGRIHDALQRAGASRRQLLGTDAAGMPVPGADPVSPQEVDTAEHLTALAAAVKRLEKRLDDDLPASREDVAEQFAALEVSVNALEDRLEAEPPGAGASDLSQLADSVHGLEARLGTQLEDVRAEQREAVSQLEGRLDGELPAVREDMARHLSHADASVREVGRRVDSELAALGDRVAPTEALLGEVSQRLDSALPAARDELIERLAPLDITVHAIEDRLEHELPALRDELSETIDKRIQSTVSQFVGREQATRDRLEARIDALRRDLESSGRRQSILIGLILLTGLLAWSC